MSIQEKIRKTESLKKDDNSGETPKTRDTVSRNWHNLDNRLSMIAESAYFKAEKRGFAFGHEEEDWFEAEQELAEIMGES